MAPAFVNLGGGGKLCYEFIAAMTVTENHF
jgi:hypothetical protein